MSVTKADTYEQREAVAAREAAAILKEDAPRTPAELAALAAIDRHRWVPVHAKDWNLAIIRLLSNADLLRDKEHEKQQAKAEEFWAGHSQRTQAAERTALGRLSTLAEQAADRLDAGDDPAEVAQWLRETGDRISEAREREAS